MRIHSSRVFLASIAVAWVSAAVAADKTDEQLIENAISAAPEAVGKNAAVVNWEMKTLRKGTNGFTCIPDDPGTPTDDPMCTDENGMAWMHAIMSKSAPPEGKVAFAYMLKGGDAASNADPYAPRPPADGKWVHDGPHVMVMNAPTIMALYPHQPDQTQPYVMFPDTPYAHLMIPVK